MKTCSKCSFQYEPGSGCPECGRIRSRERQRAKRKANPELCLEQERAYRKNNPERVRKWAGNNYAKHGKDYARTPKRMAYQREWQNARRVALKTSDPELLKAKDHARYEANAAKYAADARAKRAVAIATNPEGVRAKDRARHEARAPRIAAKREANLEEVRAKERERYAENAEAERARARAKHHRRRARLRDACSPGVTSEQWQEICAGFQDEDGNTKCVYCDKPCAATVDHVVPLARGGRDEADNVLPVCISCNSSKGARLISEWRKAKSLLAPALYALLVSHTEAYLKKAA